MNLILRAALLWSSVGLSRLQCVLEKEYFCSSIPNDFPEGLTSILFVVTNLGVLNSTIFKSPSLASVTSLALANSGISQIDPGAFHAFQSLTKLSLYQNGLTHVAASWLSNPGRLENLTMSQNLMSKIKPETFSGFSSLTTLNIASNQICEIASGAFRDLSKLTSINLSGNNLTSLTRNVFGEMKKLPVLNLGDNPWSCSCEHQDFVLFLQELVNMSLLQDAASVICHSPASRKGIHVWNVSDFNCTLSFLPSAFGNGFYSFGLPAMLAGLAFISFIFLVFWIWMVKYGNKRVRPSKEDVEPSIANSRNYSDPAEQKPSTETIESAEIARSLENRMPKVHSRSASAILMLRDFCQEQRKSTDAGQAHLQTPFQSTNNKMHVGNEDLYYFKELWDYQKLVESKRVESQIHFDPHAFLTEIHRHTPGIKDSSEAADQIGQENRNSRAHEKASIVHPEPLLYLSVTTAAEEQTENKPQDANSKRERYALKQSLSWPLERKVWDQGPHGLSVRELFTAQFLLPSLCQDKVLEAEKSKFEEEWLHLSPRRTHLLCFDDQHEANLTNKMEFPNAEAAAEPVVIKEMELGEKIQCDLHISQNKDAQIYNDQADLELEGKTDNHPDILLQKEIKLAVATGCIKAAQTGTKIAKQNTGVKPKQFSKPVSSQSRTRHETPTANTAFTSSPFEDNSVPLTKKESDYIDLLHEVVENRGRWTRKRWKQTHRSCTFHQPPAK